MKEILRTAKVWRGGISTLDVVESNHDVSISSGGVLAGQHAAESFTLSTMLNSKGGGITEVKINVPAAEFEALAALMFSVSPSQTTVAFAKALLRGK